MKEDDGNPLLLINTITITSEDTDALLAVQGRDAAVMKRQPGFNSTQPHRGFAGSTVVHNHAAWQSVGHLRAAFENADFQAEPSHYPASATASPNLFRKMAVPGICTAWIAGTA